MANWFQRTNDVIVTICVFPICGQGQGQGSSLLGLFPSACDEFSGLVAYCHLQICWAPPRHQSAHVRIIEVFFGRVWGEESLDVEISVVECSVHMPTVYDQLTAIDM